MWSLNGVRRDPRRRSSWSNRASSGRRPCAWCVVQTSAAPSVITQAGVVTASPMNASSRQRSSRRPSSQIRPQAFPVPSVLAYQSESSSHHEARPTVCRSGHGSATVAGREVDHHEAAGEQAVVARVALDDDGPSSHRARGPGPPSATTGRTACARSRAPRSSRATTALVPARSRVVGGHDRDDDVVAVPIDLPDAEIGRADLGDLARQRGRSGRAGAGHRRAGARSDRGRARRR